MADFNNSRIYLSDKFLLFICDGLRIYCMPYNFIICLGSENTNWVYAYINNFTKEMQNKSELIQIICQHDTKKCLYLN